MTDSKRKKRPADANQLAKFIVDVATGEEEDVVAESEIAKRGRLGGEKGGTARAKALTSRQRKQIAERAAAARWANKDDC